MDEQKHDHCVEKSEGKGFTRQQFLARGSAFTLAAIVTGPGLTLLSSCGGGNNTSSGNSGNIKLFYRGLTPAHDRWVNGLVKTFNTQHKGKSHLDVASVPDNNYKPKITNVLRDPNGPDIFFSWEGGWAKYMVDSGYAASLDSYYEKYNWSKRLTPLQRKLLRSKAISTCFHTTCQPPGFGIIQIFTKSTD